MARVSCRQPDEFPVRPPQRDQPEAVRLVRGPHVAAEHRLQQLRDPVAPQDPAQPGRAVRLPGMTLYQF